MDQDNLFRTLLLIGFAIIVPLAAYYRVRSQSSKEKLDRSQEGLFLLVGIRLFGFLTMAGLIAFLVNPQYMHWSALSFPVWLRWVGIAWGICAGFLWMWTFSHLGKNLTDTVVTRKEHTLVTSGPYHWVRHPFYVSIALLIFANTLATANWFIFAASFCTFVLLVIRTEKEETKLIERFGDDYRNYMKRTGKFIPKV